MKKDERTVETDNGYENTARRIALKLGLRVRVKEGPTACPDWGARGRLCDHTSHGQHYRVTLVWDRHRKACAMASMTFSFWGSRADQDKGEEPRYYDILACVASDAQTSLDPDEIAEEYGIIRPSQAIAIAEHAKHLQNFLGTHAIAAVSEIV